MRLFWVLLLVCACSQGLTGQTVGISADADNDGGSYYQGKEIEWRASTREEHPEWFSCSQDNECLGLPGTCGSSCRQEATNNVGYSDYVVQFSKVCAGSGRTISQCPQSRVYCNEGSCAVEILG